jgi:hypothetical protein
MFFFSISRDQNFRADPAIRPRATAERIRRIARAPMTAGGKIITACLPSQPAQSQNNSTKRRRLHFANRDGPARQDKSAGNSFRLWKIYLALDLRGG